jgi:hypothetical protein
MGGMTELPTGTFYAQRIRDLGEAFASTIESLDGATFHHRPAPEAWSVAEISGHVAEAPLTFATQAALLASQPGMALGRNLDDPGRLAAVAKLGDATPAEAAMMVRHNTSQAAGIVEALGLDALAASGVRVATGETFSARQMIEVNIVEHVGGHVDEVRRVAGSQ